MSLKNAYAKGARAERELMKMLTDNGFKTARIAGSGKNSADVIAIRQGKTFVFECKSSTSKMRQVPMEQLLTLIEWKNFGANPIIALKVNKDGWYLIPAYGNVVEDIIAAYKRKQKNLTFWATESNRWLPGFRNII